MKPATETRPHPVESRSRSAIGEGTAMQKNKILRARPRERLATALLTALILSIWAGCSSPSSPRTACACDKDNSNNGGVVQNLTNSDTLTKTAKASGKGAVTGAVTGESKSDVATGLLKTGVNAAGQSRQLVNKDIPLPGATVLIFDATRPTTAPETTVTTDAHGNFGAVLPAGTYFAFAIHLDLTTFRLVTAALPYMSLKKDSLKVMDTAVAVEDVTGPTVTGVYDATSPDADGLFLTSPLPAVKPRLNIVFSEPMRRESAKGITVGKLDADAAGGFALKDTLPVSAVAMAWSGDSKVLTLDLGNLEAGSRYGVVLPVSVKDLAKNPLEKEYHAAFDAVAEKDLSAKPFAVTSTFPQDKESLKPSQNFQIDFTAPPQVFSAQGAIAVTPVTEGYWEANGSRLTFVHKAPLTPGAAYTIVLADSLTDVSGRRLGRTFHWSFTVKDFDGAAKTKTGRDKDVALLVEDFFNAYLQGDVGRMAGFLSPSFRMEADGLFLSSQQFLDRIRREAGDKARNAAGFNGPVYRADAAVCSSGVAVWKVASTDARDTLWVQTRTPPGAVPKVFRGAAEVTSGLTWSKTESRFSLAGRSYVYDLADGSPGAQADPRYFGEKLRLLTTAVLLPVQDVFHDNYSIDGGIAVTDQTAKVAVKLATITRRSRRDWDPALACSDAAAQDTVYRIVKFLLDYSNGKWQFDHAVDAGEVAQKQFTQTVSDFKVKEIRPITLLSPINGMDGAADRDGNVVFRVAGLDADGVGGYLVGLAENSKFIGGRAPYGALYFVKNQGKGQPQVFTVGPQGQAVSGATAIQRDVQSLNLPGWERAAFKYPLVELFNTGKGFAGVYRWKAIAIADTSAAQFLAQGFSADRFYGESDFGPSNGSFAVKGFPSEKDFAGIDKQPDASASAAQQGFADKDLDGFPDYMEINYKTNPNDKGSYPNFLIDTDRDGLADFLENLVDSSAVETEATASDKVKFFQALKGLGVNWIDTDGDGFPDDIEKLLGYSPADPASKPATRARVPAPSGVFSGLVKLIDKAYGIKFKVRETEGTLSVTYSAYFKDTLSDTVRADLNESMGEFLFPVRLPDGGPDSGKSLLLRGAYDKTRAFLSGPVNLVTSVPRDQNAFGSGPFAGQFAASGRGEDVSGYLGVNSSGAAAAATQTQQVTPPPAAVLAYRRPPSGLGADARFALAQGSSKLFALTIIDEFGDTSAVVDSLHSYPQEDGSYDLDGRTTAYDAAHLTTRRVEAHLRLGRGKDSAAAADLWVLDGSFTESLDSCRRLVSGQCADKYFRDVPGQFSAKVAASSVTAVANGVTGRFSGWLQQDKFGTGLVDASGGNTNDTSKSAADLPPPESFANPYAGGAAAFRGVLAQAGIADGAPFYVSLRGRVMRSVNDSLSVRDAAFPYCGDVGIKAIPIPLLDGASAAEHAAFSRDSAYVSSGKYTVVAIDDEAQPGTPARLAKAKDALGFTRADVFVVETRQLDPNAFLGNKCLDGNVLPPPKPVDAGLPTLPSGSAYYRADLETLRSALTGAANRIAVLPASGSPRNADVNPATLRIDPDTQAAFVADASDPSVNYVLLAPSAQPAAPQLTGGVPSALAI